MKERSWTEKGLSHGFAVGGILAFFFVCNICPQWPCVFLWSSQCYITDWWHIGLVHRAWELPSALSSLNLLWSFEKTWNCCQARLRETKLERFGWGRLRLCSQAVIQSDRAQRWKGKDEGNRSNRGLTNEKSWLGIYECSSHKDTQMHAHTLWYSKEKCLAHCNILPKHWREVQAVRMPVPILSLCVLYSGSGAVNVGTRSSGPRQ